MVSHFASVPMTARALGHATKLVSNVYAIASAPQIGRLSCKSKSTYMQLQRQLQLQIQAQALRLILTKVPVLLPVPAPAMIGAKPKQLHSREHHLATILLTTTGRTIVIHPCTSRPSPRSTLTTPVSLVQLLTSGTIPLAQATSL